MSSAGVRKRDRHFLTVGGAISYPAFPQNGSSYSKVDVVGRQQTISISHDLSQLGKGDCGGLFETTTDFYEPIRLFEGRAKGFQWGDSYIYQYDGTLMPTHPVWWLSRERTVRSSNNQLDKFGTDAIARVHPTKPAFDAATYAVELLREGIPKAMGSALIKSNLKDLRKVGDEYLNYQFGWAPLLSGIKDMAKTMNKADKVLEQLRRDSGRVVRRRYSLVSEPTHESYMLPNRSYPVGGAINDYLLVGAPYEVHREVTTTRRRWFSGAFTYYLPEGSGQYETFQRSAAEAKKLLGVRLTPDLLWNLTPWTWAADYVANGGSVMTNLSAFSQDGLVMRYGYVMEETTTRVTDTMIGVQLNGHKKMDLKHSYGTTTKVRRGATPYGFGLNTDGFTPYQWGIIGALGISNVPKGLSRS